MKVHDVLRKGDVTDHFGFVGGIENRNNRFLPILSRYGRLFSAYPWVITVDTVVTNNVVHLLENYIFRCFATTGPRDLPYIREVTM